MEKISDNKTITIYDIAKEAGVSPATVSRVLTNNANVRKEKRERVEQLIQKYKFQPNALAKGLANTRSNIIGIIVADVRNPYYAEVYVQCEGVAQKAGYTTLLCNSHGDLNQEIELLAMLQRQKVAAIIQLGGGVDKIDADKDYIKQINKVSVHIPIVTAGNLQTENTYRVEIDASKAAELLVEYLIRLGHRRIAMIGGRMNVSSTYEKYLKYMEIMKKNNIKVEDNLIVEGNYNYSSAYEGMNSLLDRNIIPTAVIAINDFSATGVMRSTVEHGYRIPGDISIVSYDNTYFSDLLMPKLTSIDYDYALFGEMLVKTALAAIEKQEIPALQKVTPIIKIKESSAAYKPV